MFKYLKFSTFIVLLVSGCASNTPTEPEAIDPRLGEEVNQICFNRTMDSWSPLKDDNKAIIVSDRHKQEYKLSLIGTCDPEWAMMRIATISRGASNCLARGDKVITDADMNRHDSCTIMKINKWHPDKTENAKKEDADEIITSNKKDSSSKSK